MISRKFIGKLFHNVELGMIKGGNSSKSEAENDLKTSLPTIFYYIHTSVNTSPCLGSKVGLITDAFSNLIRDGRR